MMNDCSYGEFGTETREKKVRQTSTENKSGVFVPTSF